MAITVSSIDFTDFTAGRSRIEMTLATTGTYTTHGVALDFTANGLNIPTEYVPTPGWQINEQPGTAASVSGSDYSYVNGTTPANGVIQIFKGGTEQTNATAFPSASLKAVFYFQRP